MHTINVCLLFHHIMLFSIQFGSCYSNHLFCIMHCSFIIRLCHLSMYASSHVIIFHYFIYVFCKRKFNCENIQLLFLYTHMYISMHMPYMHFIFISWTIIVCIHIYTYRHMCICMHIYILADLYV